ncbi:uncharacterized protein BX664DRAFT_329518 [Halteromyces radiatus]|uniref:uncharacterized protein n=1 Tax=Halteromyces radiatus TaxID=101107 RepID=UPI00221E4693|nr:uncharacterized protein BX664DRAFT_329518 [Halteromyces radiatus]KAI8093365.1 hypothetical protein BX664DRAFT_329518 [Halteromyces radiatus]
MATVQQTTNEQLGNRRRSSTHQTFIASKTVANVLTKVKPTSSTRRLVDLPVTATIEQAFDLLLAEDILSIPVYRLDDLGKKVYVTIVGVLDLLKLLSQHTTDIVETNFFQHQIKEAIGQTNESSRLVTVQSTDSLEDVISLFSEHGAHRVLVNSNQGGQPTLLSQMDVIRYLQAHNHHLGKILDITVPSLVTASLVRRQQRLGIQQQQEEEKIKSVTFKTTAMKAFEQMANDPYISALPIVDDDDTLVGDLSPQDLRGLNKARLQDLAKPVLMFLKSRNGDLIEPFTCHHRFTLSQLMASVVLRRAYRLWWIDQETGYIQGVITLTDLLGSFLDPTLSS